MRVILSEKPHPLLRANSARPGRHDGKRKRRGKIPRRRHSL